MFLLLPKAFFSALKYSLESFFSPALTEKTVCTREREMNYTTLKPSWECRMLSSRYLESIISWHKPIGLWVSLCLGGLCLWLMWQVSFPGASDSHFASWGSILKTAHHAHGVVVIPMETNQPTVEEGIRIHLLHYAIMSAIKSTSAVNV